jgi:cobalt-zinc-cadmium efflux system membrane fusion protein
MEITTEIVAAGNLAAEIHAPGTVLSAAGGQAIVSAQAAGTVVRLYRRLGDAVKSGEALALVESRDAAALAADRSVAAARSVQARLALKREQDLFRQGVTPRQDLEAMEAQAAAADAEAARAGAVAQAAHVSNDGHTLEVRSPLAGRITAANIAIGAFVEPNTELFRIADPRFVLIEASVTALDAARIHAGDVATVTTTASSDLDAKVQSVTPTVSEQTRAATVVLTLATSTGQPLPGEFVQVHIAASSAVSAGVVVPQDAVQIVNGADVVFVRTDGGFKVQPVTVGTRSSGRAQILSGLKPGQSVATSNAFLLKAELNKGAEDDEE